MDGERFDGMGGRRFDVSQAHDDDPEACAVRSVVDWIGPSVDERHHGGGRCAYGTRTRRSRGECSQRGQRVTSMPVRRWSNVVQGDGAEAAVVGGRSASNRSAMGKAVDT